MFISIVFLVVLSLIFIALYYMDFSNKESVPLQAHTHQQRNSETFEKTFQFTTTIGAIGDLLIHDWIYEDAKKENGYDFKPMFEHVKPYLQQPDLLLANQETVLGGVEIGLSSYPSFNSPTEVGDALIDSGVDIVSTANNHTLDRGEQAILNAINYYNRVGLPYVGHFANEEDKNTIRVLESNGISFAFLAYTYGTNGIPVPEGKEYLVNLIDVEAMKKEISRAKEQADVIVMSMHWGNEYERFPSDEQKYLANVLAESGADIIFGHHPHVLQPIDWIETSDGRKVFVVYSLGNFLSGQMWDYKDIGGLATIQVTKTINKDGTEIQLANPEFLPTFISNQNIRNYKIVPLKEAGPFGLKNAKEKYEEIMNHMFQFIK